MAGDLSILKFKDNPPKLRREIRDEETLPLGTLREIKPLLEQHIPAIEWEMEPSVLSILQQTGSDLWKEWDKDQLASASRSRLVGIAETEEFLLRFHSLPTEDDTELRSLLVELHSVGNPYIPLKSLCERNGWSAVGPNPDDEFIDFDQAIAEWEEWERNQDQYLEEAQERQSQRRSEIASFNQECQEFLAGLLDNNAACPKCKKHHMEWRCVIPDDPDRRAYFVCRQCGGSVQRDQFS